MSETMWYFSFCAWLTSLKRMLSSFICVVANGRISLFFMAKQYSMENIDHRF
jgi:hypothetical protein